MRWFIVLTLTCLLPTPLDAWTRGNAGQQGWQILRIGGGGFLPNIDIQCDQGVGACNNSGTTTKVVRADVYGAYWFNPATTNCGNSNLTGCWQQIVTTLSMPAGDIDTNGGAGVYEIVIAPSNTSHFYMMYAGKVLSSTNKGATWTDAPGWTPVTADPNDHNRAMGPFMAVDPGNENELLVGTPSGGVFYTTNGGTTFTHIAGIPNSGAPAQGQGNALIAFDQTTTSGGATPGIYASSYGNGVYHTATGPAGTWTQLASTPTTHWRMICDQSGNLFLVDNAGNGSGALHEYNGSWSTPGSATIGANAESIAVDPNNASHVYVMHGNSNPGDLYGTITGPGGTWFETTVHSRTAADIPWLAVTNESFMTPGNIKFDPSGSNLLYFSEGIGVWTVNPPTAVATVAWVSRTAAIDELNSNQIISPPGGNPIYMAQDRPEFLISNPALYPSAHGCVNPTTNSIVDGYIADWATSSPSTIVAMCSMVFSPWTDESGSSTNSGSTFSAFGTIPPNISGSGAARGGCIAATSSTNLLWVETNNAGPFVSSNSGGTWAAASVTGVTGGWPSNQQTIKNCTADRVTANTFYLYSYNADGAFSDAIARSTDGGTTWTRRCLACASGSNMDSASGINGFFYTLLDAMPGQAGELFFSPGHKLGVSHPQTQPFYKSTDGGTTWTAIANVNDVWAFGFGAAKNGSSFATIYIYGWVGGVLGTWRSIDNASTWTQLDNGYPLGIFAPVSTLSGDNNTYGKVYECFGNAGCVYGQFNFLLSRDLNPANDNTPMWLNAVA